jgi:hypothetical protein
MTIGKQTQIPVKAPTELVKAQNDDEYITTAIIKTMNVYDRVSGKYTSEINQKTVKVETFVADLKTEKPQIIGYISVSTIEKFLDGKVKAIPIKQRKN